MRRSHSTGKQNLSMTSSRYHSLLIGILAFACERSPKPVASSPTSSVVEAPSIPSMVGASAADTASPCPHTGLWAPCSVERRLKQSGFVVKRLDESPERPGFTVKPVVYKVGSARLEVFLYPDASSLTQAMSKLDTVTVSPVGSVSLWETAPLLIRSGNLAAVFLTQSPIQAERLTLALTAGAPQPGSPR
jgi:hypothetical protein